jgi:uncharacterized membrane protein YkgB
MQFSTRFIFLFARISLFIIYFWFGILKVIGDSPAEELVHHLCAITVRPFIDDAYFIPLFGLFEMLLGMAMLIPRITKFSVQVLWLHLVLTVMPLIVLPNDSWQALLSPTLVGQYIIKNLALLSLSFMLYAYCLDLKSSE